MSPVRIQRKRTKGWRMPEGAVYVGRPSKWGNPYVVHEHDDRTCGEDLENCHVIDHASTPAEAVRAFEYAMRWPLSGEPTVPHPDDIRAELAGRDLACWCPLDQPCHADVLLEVANS